MSENDVGVLVALREAAARLGVSSTTVKLWVRTGKLHGRRFGGELYVPAQEIQALQNSCSCSHAGGAAA